MDALAGIFRNVYRCLIENHIGYESFSVSLADGVEIVVSKEEAERIHNALQCIENKLPPAWKNKIKVKVIE